MSREKEKELGYTIEELSGFFLMKPTFACPNCQSKNWNGQTLVSTTPTRLWRCRTNCVTCKKDVRWLLDPDLTIPLQTKEMHRPIGFGKG